MVFWVKQNMTEPQIEGLKQYAKENGLEFIDYSEWDYAMVNLDEEKEAKIAELKAKRDAEELAPVSFMDNNWDFDDKSQQRINGAIIALGNNTIAWTSADNTIIENVSADMLRGVIGAAALRSNELHIKYRELKEQVAQAKTYNELSTIAW